MSETSPTPQPSPSGKDESTQQSNPCQEMLVRLRKSLQDSGFTVTPMEVSSTPRYTANFVPRKPEKSQPVPSHAEEIEESDSESQLTSRGFYDDSLIKKYGQPLEFPDFEWRYNLLKTEEANELIDELNFDLTEYLVIAETCSAFGCLIEHGSDTDSMAGDITIYFLYCRGRDTLEGQVTRKLRKIKKFLV